MSRFGYEEKRSSSFKKFVLLLSFPFTLIVIAYVVYKLFFIPDPVIEGIDALSHLSLDKTVTLNCSNLKSINIFVNQNGRQTELLRDMPEDSEKTYTLQIKPKELDLADGSAIITVIARSGFLKEIKYEINTTVDTVPPALQVLKAASTVYQGSAGFAVLGAKDADTVYIDLEGRRYRAFKAAAEPDQELPVIKKKAAANYFVFFPVPLEIQENARFFAVAEDTAGNKTVRSLRTRLKSKEYRTSSITIDDSFINSVVSPLLNETAISDPVRAFKTVNEKWREDNQKKLYEINEKTGPEILWKGRFLQMKNSKVMATYGDKRTYFYNEAPVSNSVHLGYDLASVSNAPVEAANTGIVRFAGELGIYGNTVVIDHGLGIMSLYGHLSTIMVNEGQMVNKGDVVARTGLTGLAGGDHLHFGILVHGYAVSPLYWWDTRWLKTNILDHLEEFAGVN